ncbi:MAG: FtsX-like permease family protein [Planctomycetota bacterium]|jgi:lipoprotein-releasing system permease protein
MLKIFLWLRYLRKRKIVLLSIAAVALTTALLIVVSSLFSSFIGAFEKSAVDMMGDIVIAPRIKFEKYPIFIEQLESSGIAEAATPTLTWQGLLYLGPGNVRAVTVLGIEPESRTKVTTFKKALRKQGVSQDEPGFDIPDLQEQATGFLGAGVIAGPDEETDEYDFEAIEKMIGAKVTLTTGALSTSQGQDGPKERIKRRLLTFTVKDIVYSGIYEIDRATIYLPIEKLQQKIYPDADGPVATQLLIKIADNVPTDIALAKVWGLWMDFVDEHLAGDISYLKKDVIMTSQQMQSLYIGELQKQMWMLLLIFGVVSLSIILLISCILYMIVITRQKDIAIIKGCGASNMSVLSIFMGFGSCVGLIGSFVGLILGSIIIKNINTIEEWIRVVFGLKLWKSSVYMFSVIPNQMYLGWAVGIMISAVAAATVGALIPAIVAAKTRPVDILRYE